VGLFAKLTGLWPAHRFRSADASDDPVDHQQRIGLTLLCILAVSIGCGLLAHRISSGSSSSAWQVGVWAFGTIAGGALGLTLAGRWLRKTLSEESGLVSRLVLIINCWVGAWIGLVVFAPLSELIGSAFPRDGHLQSMMWASFLPLLMLDLQQLLSARRRQRIAIGPAVLTGFAACLLALPFGGDPVFSMGVAAGITLAVQVTAPFIPRQSRRAKAVETSRAQKLDSGSSADQRSSADQPVAAAAGVSEPTAAPSPTDQPVVPQVVAGIVSPRSRTIALILAVGPAFSGICGLQRFYVGKIWTGLLYLFTAGVMGIGQLIDVVLIATGQFQDDQLRRVEAWEGSSVSGVGGAVPVNSWSAVPSRTRWGVLLANLLGVLLLLASCLVGLFAAARIPDALAAWEQAGLFDSTISQNLAEVLGTESWPRIASRLGTLAALILYLSGLAVLLLARHRDGPGHMFRAILGSLCCLATVGMFALTFQGRLWDRLAEQVAAGQVGAALEMVVADQFLATYVLAGIALLVGIMLLCWPAASASRLSPSDESVKVNVP
jgi:hypothetical protein